MNDLTVEEIEVVDTPPIVIEVAVKTKRDPAKLKEYRDKHIAKKKRGRHGPHPKRKEKKPAKRKAASKRGPKGWAPEDRRRDGSKKYGLMLRKKRLELGYTQAEFAEFFNIKQPHMCNLEKGTFRPGPKLKALIDKKFFAQVGRGKPRKGAPKA